MMSTEPRDLEALRRFVWVRLPKAVVLERDRYDAGRGVVELVLSGPGGERTVTIDAKEWAEGAWRAAEEALEEAARAVAGAGSTD